MKICFICSEIFAWGKYGGFGRATRIIGKELVKRGIDVSAVVPRRGNQKNIEILDGITVFSYPMWDFVACRALLKKMGADLYHSEQPSLATFLAISAAPHKKHLVTSRDPKTIVDWFIEMKNPSINHFRSALAFLYENNYFVKKAVRRADAVYYCARYLDHKVRKLYSVNDQLGFLPTPVYIPKITSTKSVQPTVCFLARWDRRKRPGRFFEIAKKFPDVQFIAPGESQNKNWDQLLRKKYGHLPNVEMPGFLNQFSAENLWNILEKSWILINTATREGLPTSFLEALAHQCALLSQSNPEDVTSRFGYHVQEDEFEEGLQYLLANDRWRQKGISGFEYVRENYELQKSIDRHIVVYNQVLSR